MKTMLTSIVVICICIWIFIIIFKVFGIDIVGGIKSIISHIRGDNDPDQTV